MKFSEHWLKEWLGSEVDSDYLIERLTMSGLEVDGVEAAAAEFSNVVVAKVLSVEPHPDADKLRICSVDCNDEQTLQIVCGAANVRKDLTVALARIGAKLPGGFKIKKSKLRGVESFGMLCSEKELGLAEDADGLMELPDELEAGEDIRQALFLEDNIIELSLTPNRGDCFSISGIARDVAVFCNVPYQPLKVDAVEPVIQDSLAVTLESPEACNAYAGRIIKDINVSASTPLWMIEKLRRSGIRGISPVVDITNFVMIELGQPMHAFDAKKLAGDIHVRHANANEKLTLLDGEEVELDTDTLLIADDEKPLAMAGVMGGLESSVTDSTNDIFLESAFFTPEMIIGDARKYGLHTDSSHRFERGVDFELNSMAIERATKLIIDICGGQAGPVTLAKEAEHLPKRTAVKLRKAQIERRLGLNVETDLVESILRQLGLDIENKTDGWEVTPPSYRFDINLEVDLIEEIARVIGYDNIQSQQMVSSLQMRVEDPLQTSLNRCRDILVNRGYQEAITYSFVAPELNALFRQGGRELILANPISSDLSAMRCSLIPGLLLSLQYNVNRQQSRVRLFESGLVFEQADELKQILKVAGVIYGEVEPEQWDRKTSSCDYYDLKSDLEALISKQLSSESVKFQPCQQSFLHPGQSSEILINNQSVGYIGGLHPNLLSRFDLNKAAFVFELALGAISVENTAKIHEISKFPSIRRDISIILDETISVAKISETIKKSAPDLLINLELFDLYQGEHIDIGKKSLTFGLTFQRSSSTLTDVEVESLKEEILDSLRNELGATLRE